MRATPALNGWKESKTDGLGFLRKTHVNIQIGLKGSSIRTDSTLLIRTLGICKIEWLNNGAKILVLASFQNHPVFP